MLSSFLAQFKVNRISESLESNPKIFYDEEKDYNVITGNLEVTNLVATKTAVKTEQPDQAYEDYYLQTKTITEVRKEEPDEIKIASENEKFSYLLQTMTSTDVKGEEADKLNNEDFIGLMSTQTMTKVKVESSDADYQ